MNTKFSHVNIISKDWKKLAEFYMNVFECKPKLPERNLSGEWVDDLTNLSNTQIKGIHLILPGFDSNGPTLEIFEYNKNLGNSDKCINLEGFGHIAFSVEDVEQKLKFLLENGQLILTFRDYSVVLTNEQRFIPVKSDDNKILTCIIDYFDTKITVTDLLHEKNNGEWTQKVSSYYKLRLKTDYVLELVEKTGFSVCYNKDVNGMIHLILKK